MEPILTDASVEEKLSFDRFREEILKDYRIAYESREASLLGRKEVLTGKAKFGIFGDGKEVAQVAMAKFFKPGDWRAGYYRDQTFMFASGLATIEQFFAQLYADPDINNDPFSAGRQMNSHFATRVVDENGDWLDIVNRKNISSDMAPTAGQMPRALGLAYASKFFRNVKEVKDIKDLSDNGNEICFCSIGDASTSEGHFWETINAAGVMQVPLAIFVWDDGYGISVPREIQTTKGSISAVLRGFQKQPGTNGIDIYKLRGWDYAGMCEILEPAIQNIRDTHTPALFHVDEMTQPQGHSTSGSHERYKHAERLVWEREMDCLKQMRAWIITNALADKHELDAIERSAKTFAKQGQKKAWEKYINPIKEQVSKTVSLLKNISADNKELKSISKELLANPEPMRKDVLIALSNAMSIADPGNKLASYHSQLSELNQSLYNTELYNDGPKAAVNIPEIKVNLPADAPSINGYEVLNKYFDQLFATNIKVVAFGEDVGLIGDVNQGFSGLQAKYGDQRIFDTSIRELTIMGQGIGMALRGLRPIAEIQYIDYLLYGLQALSDDAATTHYRTKGQQSVPLIVRSRGHRLEGIWHSGSPMGMIINSLRGMYVCVPRNMVQAIGMYNTLLRGNDPAIVIECLNGYRLKEKLPSNLTEYTIPLGIPEVVNSGDDITIVSYGSTLRVVQEAADILQRLNISCEIIDVRTLLPFDSKHRIAESLQKTNRIVFIDEDVPGGAAAFMFNKVMEEQNGYKWLDVSPRTITAKDHRPAYGSDGDYFSKPNVEDVVRVVKEMMKE